MHPRTGTVADPDGGALRPLAARSCRLGVGGRLGSGKQWWSLISLADEVGAIRHVIDHEALVGPVNLAAPEQVTNGDLTEALGQRPAPPDPGVRARLALCDSSSASSPTSCSSTSACSARGAREPGLRVPPPDVAAIIDDLLG